MDKEILKTQQVLHGSPMDNIKQFIADMFGQSHGQEVANDTLNQDQLNQLRLQAGQPLQGGVSYYGY